MDYYRFNTAKYRKDTRHLTTFQHGCYRLLIDEYMETREPLPDNQQALANICHCMLQAFTEHAWSTLVAFFKQKDGLLFHDYCDAELAFQDNRRKFASEKAKKAAKIRHSKNKELLATSIAAGCQSRELRVESREYIMDREVEERANASRSSSATISIFEWNSGELSEIPSQDIKIKIGPNWELPHEWGVIAERLGMKPNDIIWQSKRMKEKYTLGKHAGRTQKLSLWKNTWVKWIEISAKEKTK